MHWGLWVGTVYASFVEAQPMGSQKNVGANLTRLISAAAIALPILWLTRHMQNLLRQTRSACGGILRWSFAAGIIATCLINHVHAQFNSPALDEGFDTFTAHPCSFYTEDVHYIDYHVYPNMLPEDEIRTEWPSSVRIQFVICTKYRRGFQRDYVDAMDRYQTDLDNAKYEYDECVETAFNTLALTAATVGVTGGLAKYFNPTSGAVAPATAAVLTAALVAYAVALERCDSVYSQTS